MCPCSNEPLPLSPESPYQALRKRLEADSFNNPVARAMTEDFFSTGSLSEVKTRSLLHWVEQVDGLVEPTDESDPLKQALSLLETLQQPDELRKLLWVLRRTVAGQTHRHVAQLAHEESPHERCVAAQTFAAWSQLEKLLTQAKKVCDAMVEADLAATNERFSVAAETEATRSLAYVLFQAGYLAGYRDQKAGLMPRVRQAFEHAETTGRLPTLPHDPDAS